jgi:two-component system, LuxR family, response regulator FixJ
MGVQMSQPTLVLVVDDDESMRDAIHGLLDETGFANATYGSAEALLAGGRIAEAFCLISDFRLPSMSGLDLLGELRRQRIELPAIVITGHDAPGLAEDAAKQGAVAYFVKPFSAGALLAALRNLQGGASK